MEFWIFTFQNAKKEPRVNGKTVLLQRGHDKFYGVEDKSEREVPNVHRVSEGDSIILYAGGTERCFMGSCKAASELTVLSKAQKDGLCHSPAYSVNRGIFLRNVVVWNDVLPLIRAFDRVSGFERFSGNHAGPVSRGINWISEEEYQSLLWLGAGKQRAC